MSVILCLPCHMAAAELTASELPPVVLGVLLLGIAREAALLHPVTSVLACFFMNAVVRTPVSSG